MTGLIHAVWKVALDLGTHTTLLLSLSYDVASILYQCCTILPIPNLDSHATMIFGMYASMEASCMQAQNNKVKMLMHTAVHNVSIIGHKIADNVWCPPMATKCTSVKFIRLFYIMDVFIWQILQEFQQEVCTIVVMSSLSVCEFRGIPFCVWHGTHVASDFHGRSVQICVKL